MQVAKTQLIESRGIGSQAVGGDDLRLYGLVAEQSTKELGRCGGVPFPLHYKVKDLAFVIHGAPEVDAPATHFADHLIEMPPR